MCIRDSSLSLSLPPAFCIYIYKHRHKCLSVCLPLCLSVRLSVSLPVFRFVWLSQCVTSVLLSPILNSILNYTPQHPPSLPRQPRTNKTWRVSRPARRTLHTELDSITLSLHCTRLAANPLGTLGKADSPWITQNQNYFIVPVQVYTEICLTVHSK